MPGHILRMHKKLNKNIRKRKMSENCVRHTFEMPLQGIVSHSVPSITLPHS